MSVSFITLDLTKPIRTRHGWPVTILADGINTTNGETIVAKVKLPAGHDAIMCYFSDGHYRRSRDDDDFDLVNVVTKQTRTGWLNIYPDQSIDQIHPSRLVADALHRSDRIACVQINYTFETT